MPGGRGARGGYQAPAKPAAVSGPGSLSQRTDGGPSQPVRVAPGGPYGSRQAMVAQQQAAPMREGGPVTPPPGGPGAGAAPAVNPAEGLDPFGPSRRPSEPATAGAATGPGSGAPSADQTSLELLQFLLPTNPELLPLIEELDAGIVRG